jgi:hypothetical protein
MLRDRTDWEWQFIDLFAAFIPLLLPLPFSKLPLVESAFHIIKREKEPSFKGKSCSTNKSRIFNYL